MTPRPSRIPATPAFSMPSLVVTATDESEPEAQSSEPLPPPTTAEHFPSRVASTPLDAEVPSAIERHLEDRGIQLHDP
eukprot:5105860-Amphidinium_carterae.1